MTPGTSSPRCAVHPERLAVTTCRRCGTFACPECADAQGLCAACRRLDPASAGFPLDRSASLGELWDAAWTAWKANWLMLLLATVILMAMLFGASLASALIGAVFAVVSRVSAGGEPGALASAAELIITQTLSTLLSTAVQAVGLGGLYRLLIDALLGRTVDLGRMFSQLRLAPRLFAVQLLLLLVITVPLVVLLLVLTPLVAGDLSWAALVDPSRGDPQEALRMVPKVLMLAAVATAVLMPYLLVVLPVSVFAPFEALVGECGAVEALRRAWLLGRGQRLRLTGYASLAGLVIFAGFLLCLVGALPAIPLAYLLLVALFLALRNGAGFPGNLAG